MLQRTGEAETITTHYLAALGLYRGLYIPNWIYRCVGTRHDAEGESLTDFLLTRYVTEGSRSFDPIAIVAGIIQTIIYADFGYIVSPPTACLNVHLSLTMSLRSSFSSMSQSAAPNFAFTRMHTDRFRFCRVLRGQKFELPA